ncbi:MAG: ferredoxin [Alphaproteobacteria bacterium]
MYMRAGFQADCAFYHNGTRLGGALDTIDDLGLTPALFARHRDLTRLRYDFPLVLLRNSSGKDAAKPLSALIDAVCHEFDDAQDSAIYVHALRFEREIRVAAATHGSGGLQDLMTIAAKHMLSENASLYRDSIERLRKAIKIDGMVTDCNIAMPCQLFHHYWETVHRQKAQHFREMAGRLVVKLARILHADFVRSPEGLSPANLEAAMGTTQRTTFDFNALSELLLRTTSKKSLSESRRKRISWMLTTLESQRFYPPLTEGDDQHEPYSFVFENTADAMAAYRDRLPQMVELSKAIAMAGLEIAGEFDERFHVPFFAEYSIDNLDPDDFGLLPDYLILTHMSDIQPSEAETLQDAFAGGMRAKILVQADDILAIPAFTGGNISPAVRSRQMVNAAISLGEFYVFQAPGSQLPRMRESLANGFAHPGPALFSVYSGGATGTDHSLPPYMLAAAALESRAFPALTYDPLAGDDWPSRYHLTDTPQAERSWPTYPFAYEDAEHHSIEATLAFTVADFVACDARYYKHFARVPRENWSDAMVPLSDFLDMDKQAAAQKVPYLLMADADGVLHKVLVDEKIVQSVRRTTKMWLGLQELAGLRGGYSNMNGHDRSQTPAPASMEAPEPQARPEPATSKPQPEAPAAPSSDDAYIETIRCSTCNECIHLNDKMFAYDDNQQAYIKDINAGLYRQLVEAAENCPLSIIHPGQPRNPDEAGLDDLIKRAEPFL